MGGGLTAFFGTASSSGFVSVLAQSVSILLVFKGAKKLRAAATLAGVSMVADAAVVTAFFGFRAASPVLCRFRHLTSLKQSSWVAEDFGI
jgi:hypothetical protein